jgi:hypothetical protein
MAKSTPAKPKRPSPDDPDLGPPLTAQLDPEQGEPVPGRQAVGPWADLLRRLQDSGRTPEEALAYLDAMPPSDLGIPPRGPDPGGNYGLGMGPPIAEPQPPAGAAGAQVEIRQYDTMKFLQLLREHTRNIFQIALSGMHPDSRDLLLDETRRWCQVCCKTTPPQDWAVYGAGLLETEPRRVVFQLPMEAHEMPDRRGPRARGGRGEFGNLGMTPDGRRL